MATATIDGWEFAYSDTGTGPSVVLLHGLLMDRTMWDHQIDALSDSYRVITVDAPGHGESPGRPVGFTLAEESAALTKLVTGLGVDQAVWGGHSLGAFNSLCVVLDAPERVRALILIDGNAGPENPDMVPQYDAMFEVAKQDGVSLDLANVAFTILSTEAFASSAEGQHWVKKISAMDANSAEGTARAVFDRTSRLSELPKVTTPTLILHGVDDFPNPIEGAREAAAAIPNAELIEIEACGHTAPVEKPVEVTTAIRAFLGRLPE
ncbi:MAG: alpha/beta fold hydrolase [Actinomycetota bacterium]|nr:alpha/beta hydrolase [Actinomycetota bacterium]